MKKLGHFVRDFRQSQKDKKMFAELSAFESLRKFLPEFFPSRSTAETFYNVLLTTQKESKRLFRSRNDKGFDDHNVFSMVNLPLHTHDVSWLTAYISRKLDMLGKDSLLPDINNKYIESFVKIDPIFQNRLHEYETDIIRAAIIHLMREVDESGFKERNSSVAKIKDSINAVEDFRQEVINRMTKFGYDVDLIETALETYANIWREAMMDYSFDNQCINPLLPGKDHLSYKNYCQVLDKVENQRGNWKKIAEYDYYQLHGAKINEVGLNITENMKMNRDLVATVRRAWNNNYQSLTKEFFTSVHVPDHETTTIR